MSRDVVPTRLVSEGGVDQHDIAGRRGMGCRGGEGQRRSDDLEQILLIALFSDYFRRPPERPVRDQRIEERVFIGSRRVSCRKASRQTSGALLAIFSSLDAIVGKRQSALSNVLHLVFMEKHGCILVRLTHDFEEQVGNPFIDYSLLLGGGPVSARACAFARDRM
jgi:hypothetical protein